MKIQYQNKEAIDLQPEVPAKNKVTDVDMNEIKTVVNANADTLDDVNETVTGFVNDVDNRLGIVESTVVNLDDRLDTDEDNISNLQSAVANIEDTTYTKTETDSLLDDLEISLENYINNEATYRENADTNLQNQIDAIVASSDVVDIVGTYQELQNYDTSHLGNNDIIKVLNDSTHNSAISYYRWKKQSNIWQYIGSEGPYYTKGETDNLLNGKVNKEAGKGLSQNDFTNSLKNKLDGIEANAQVNTVTGVKGNSEFNYRVGNINITKANIGLGNVDNTSDLNKPVSNATTTELNKKINKTSIITTLSSASTNAQIVGAKTVYDELQLKENLSNKVTELDDSDEHYPTTHAVKTVTNNIIDVNNTQNTLINSLFQIAPKTDYGEGTDITLENTLPFYLDFENNIIGYGDIEQEKTEGYNELNPSLLSIFNSNNYIRTANYATQGSINVKPSTAYEFYLNSFLGDGKIYEYDENGTQVKYTPISSQAVSKYTSFTTDSTTKKIGFYAKITNDGTTTIQVAQPMLYEGTTEKSYEAYTGNASAPSSSYRFPIKSVTGNQTVQILDANNTVITTKNLSLGSKKIFEDSYISKESDGFYFNDYFKEIEIDDTFTWTMDSNENWAGNRFTCQNIPSLGASSSTTFTDAYNNYASIGNVSDYTSHLNTFILRYINNKNRIDCIFDLESVEDLKTLLANEPMKVVFRASEITKTKILDTTLIGQLEEIYNLMSVNGTTKIKITGDLPMIMKVRALKNLSINSIDDRLSLLEE